MPHFGLPQRVPTVGTEPDILRRMDESAFVAELERAVGTEFVVTHPHAKRTYESDGLLQYAVTPRAVLPDGSLVTLGGKELDTPGYDLLGAFIGSEGTLGVATRITLRIVPKPESVRTLVAFFDSVEEAGEVVSEIVAAGIVAGAMEMM